jgi:hypothetical protein
MTLGNLAVYWQSDPRRLLGWSTGSQVGHLVVPVVVAGRTDLALPSLLVYLTKYTVTNIGAFAVTAAVPDRRDLESYRKLAASRPWLAAALVVVLLGLVGTPPTAVFAGKLCRQAHHGDGRLGRGLRLARRGRVRQHRAQPLLPPTPDSSRLWDAGGRVGDARGLLCAAVVCPDGTCCRSGESASPSRYGPRLAVSARGPTDGRPVPDHFGRTVVKSSKPFRSGIDEGGGAEHERKWVTAWTAWGAWAG